MDEFDIMLEFREGRLLNNKGEIVTEIEEAQEIVDKCDVVKNIQTPYEPQSHYEG